MTPIRQRFKPVWHETGYADRGRAMVVAETPHNLLIRLKGTRQVMQLPWSMIYLKAAQTTAALARLERINKKRAVKSAQRRT